MPDNNLKVRARLRETVIEEDDAALEGVKTIEDYAPHNPDVSTDKLVAKKAERDAARTEERDLERRLAAARDASTKREHEFHDMIVVMREQVVAQKGKSSDEAVAVGLKKKSEYGR